MTDMKVLLCNRKYICYRKGYFVWVNAIRILKCRMKTHKTKTNQGKNHISAPLEQYLGINFYVYIFLTAFVLVPFCNIHYINFCVHCMPRLKICLSKGHYF